MSAVAGKRGDDVRNDGWVELTPGHPEIRIESPVYSAYGRRIEAVAKETLASLGISDVGAHIVDSGAFDWCIAARIEAAANRLSPALPKTRSAEPSLSIEESRRRTRRTRLYLPGNTPKFFVNARLYGADAVVLDLEDAVPSNEKDEARYLVRSALRSVDFGTCERIVRINAGEVGLKDLEFVEGAGAEAILLPKTESSGQIEAIRTGLGVIPLIESARGVAQAHEIAAASGVVALAIGVEDYLADIGAGREGLAYAYSQIVNAARAAGVAPLGSVWTDLDDVEGLRRETARLFALGFEGVGCLHPAQIKPVLDAIRPAPAEVEEARAIVEAFEASGGAVAVNGRMVDAPVAQAARRRLSRAESPLPAWRLP